MPGVPDVNRSLLVMDAIGGAVVTDSESPEPAQVAGQRLGRGGSRVIGLGFELLYQPPSDGRRQVSEVFRDFALEREPVLHRPSLAFSSSRVMAGRRAARRSLASSINPSSTSRSSRASRA